LPAQELHNCSITARHISGFSAAKEQAMFRTILSAVVAAAFLGMLAARAPAEDEVNIAGTIMKIDGNNITVVSMDKEQKMTIEPQTKITSGGKPVSPVDLKVGQKVKCTGDRHGEEVFCTTMEIMRDTP
jgi:hypothetical protein